MKPLDSMIKYTVFTKVALEPRPERSYEEDVDILREPEGESVFELFEEPKGSQWSGVKRKDEFRQNSLSVAHEDQNPGNMGCVKEAIWSSPL